jgi:hypothetical protein
MCPPPPEESSNGWRGEDLCCDGLALLDNRAQQSVSCLENSHVCLNQSSISVRSGTAVAVTIGAAVVVTVAALLLVLQSALVWAVFSPLLANLTPPILDTINDPWRAWIVRYGYSFELLREVLLVGIILFALAPASLSGTTTTSASTSTAVAGFIPTFVFLELVHCLLEIVQLGLES